MEKQEKESGSEVYLIPTPSHLKNEEAWEKFQMDDIIKKIRENFYTERVLGMADVISDLSAFAITCEIVGKLKAEKKHGVQ